MANIWERVGGLSGIANYIFKGQTSRKEVDAQGNRWFEVGWSGLGGGILPSWEMAQSRNFVEEGFNRNSIIYSALMFKAKAVAAAPLRAYRGDERNFELLEPNHPVAQLVRRPNPDQSWYEFQSLNTIWKNLSGNVYVALIRSRSSMLPERMVALPPHRVKIVYNPKLPHTDPDWLIGYAYTPEDWDGSLSEKLVIFLPEDVRHIKLPNPGDPFGGRGYGLSPVMALAESGDVDNAVTTFVKMFFDGGGVPPVAIKYAEPVEDDEKQRIRARWREIYGGYKNWSEIGILDNGAGLERIGFTFNEMGFEGLDERNESRILGPLGVPPILIGTRMGLARSTYSNYEEARRAFWEDTMIPELSQDEEEYQDIFNDGDIFVQFDLSDVPALRRDAVGQANAAHKLWMMGVPARQALDTVGLQVDSFEGEDEPRSITMPPIPALPSGGDDEPSADDEEDDDSEKSAAWHELNQQIEEIEALLEAKADDDIPADLRTAGETVIAQADGWQPSYEEKAAEMFEADRRDVLAIVNEEVKAARSRKASINWETVAESIIAFLENEGEERWREAFIPLLEGTIEDAGTTWSAALGVEFDVRNIRGEAWFSEYTLQFAQPINETTKTDIQEILLAAQEEGWSIPETQDWLTELFNQYIDGELSDPDLQWFSDRLPPHRTELIARTETLRASNTGTFHLGETWNVQEKMWMATGDDRTRPSHVEADGQRRPLDEPFDVGGYKMMHPHDMSLGAPLSEVANCRCPLVLLPPDEE